MNTNISYTHGFETLVFCELSLQCMCRNHKIFMLFNFWSTDPTHRKDYYKILGVSPNADQKQIKKAYFEVI